MKNTNEIALTLQIEPQNNLYNVFCAELNISVTDKDVESAVSQVREIVQFNSLKLASMNGECPERLKTRQLIASRIISQGIEKVKFVYPTSLEFENKAANV